MQQIIFKNPFIKVAVVITQSKNNNQVLDYLGYCMLYFGGLCSGQLLGLFLIFLDSSIVPSFIGNIRTLNLLKGK